jgi:FSR family fosmidomycin resistance protein-like MFS transporter
VTVAATTRPQEKAAFDHRGVLAVSGCHTAHDMYGSCVGALLPVLIDRLAIPVGAAGVLVGAYRLPSLLQPFLGHWADHYDARLLVVFMPTLAAVAITSLGLASGYGATLALLVVAGLASAAFHPAAGAMVTRVGGDSWGRASAYFATGGEIGRTLGPAMIGSVLFYLAFEQIWVMALPAIAWSVFAYTQIAGKNARVRRPPPPAALGAAIKAQRGPLALMATIILLRSLAIASFQIYLPTYLKQGGTAVQVAAFALTAFEVGAVAGQFVGGALSDRFGRRRMMVFSQLTAGPVLFAALSLAQTSYLFAALLVGGFLAVSAGAVQMALMQELLPGNRSVAVGISYLLSFESQLVATLVIGFAADLVGLGDALSVSVWLSMASIPFTLLLPEPRRG